MSLTYEQIEALPARALNEAIQELVFGFRWYQYVPFMNGDEEVLMLLFIAPEEVALYSQQLVGFDLWDKQAYPDAHYNFASSYNSTYVWATASTDFGLGACQRAGYKATLSVGWTKLKVMLQRKGKPKHIYRGSLSAPIALIVGKALLHAASADNA
jgi:hypothetical protein